MLEPTIIGDTTDQLAGEFATPAPATVDLQEPVRPPLPARARAQDPLHRIAKLRQDGQESNMNITYYYGIWCEYNII
jgi:hypothetical protein